MRKLLLIGSVMAALAPWAAGGSLTTVGEHNPEPTWYLAHLGAEPCVPISDIGANFDRVYYQAGPYRTPDDFRAAWQRASKQVPGAKVSAWHPKMPAGTRAFEVSAGELHVWILLFADEDRCQAAMADSPK